MSKSIWSKCWKLGALQIPGALQDQILEAWPIYKRPGVAWCGLVWLRGVAPPGALLATLVAILGLSRREAGSADFIKYSFIHISLENQVFSKLQYVDCILMSQKIWPCLFWCIPCGIFT